MQRTGRHVRPKINRKSLVNVRQEGDLAAHDGADEARVYGEIWGENCYTFSLVEARRELVPVPKLLFSSFSMSSPSMLARNDAAVTKKCRSVGGLWLDEAVNVT